jgi:hypothetical protein
MTDSVKNNDVLLREFERLLYLEKHGRDLIASLPERMLILDGTNFHQDLRQHYAVGWSPCDILVDIENGEGAIVRSKEPLGMLLSEAEKARTLWVFHEMLWETVAEIWANKPQACENAGFDKIYSKGKREKPPTQAKPHKSLDEA